jgi:hypothetical protein
MILVTILAYIGSHTGQLLVKLCLYLQILGNSGIGQGGGGQDGGVTGHVQDPQVDKVLLVELGEDLVVPVEQVHVLLVILVGLLPAQPQPRPSNHSSKELETNNLE